MPKTETTKAKAKAETVQSKPAKAAKGKPAAKPKAEKATKSKAAKGKATGTVLMPKGWETTKGVRVTTTPGQPDTVLVLGGWRCAGWQVTAPDARGLSLLVHGASHETCDGLRRPDLQARLAERISAACPAFTQHTDPLAMCDESELRAVAAILRRAGEDPDAKPRRTSKPAPAAEQPARAISRERKAKPGPDGTVEVTMADLKAEEHVAKRAARKAA